MPCSPAPECQYLNELDKDQEWSKSVESLLQEAIHERNQRPTESLETKPWLARLDKLIDENLSKLSEKFTTFKNGLLKMSGLYFQLPSKTRQYRQTQQCFGTRHKENWKIKLKNLDASVASEPTHSWICIQLSRPQKKHGNRLQRYPSPFLRETDPVVSAE